MKYELYGTREDAEYGYGGYTGNKIPVRELVATFSTEELAREYARKAELASSRKSKYSWDKAFRQKSLLSSYTGYEIEEEQAPIEIEHDPIL